MWYGMGYYKGLVLIYPNSSLVFSNRGLLLGKHFDEAIIVVGYGLYLKARFWFN
jgi:hypothetical protein